MWQARLASVRTSSSPRAKRARPAAGTGPATYAYAALMTGAAALASALIVRRRIDRLDLVAVLKSRD